MSTPQGTPHSGGGQAHTLKGTGELLALGMSHKTAPVALRERLAFSDAQAVEFAQQAIASPQVSEAVVISTCNRTEVYLVVGGAGGDPVQAEADVLGMLARRASIRPTELAQEIYSPRNCEAARQLYRVTSGLESMIVGEAEIQGQVKRTYEAALAAGTTGPLSNRLFAAALTTGKRVRSETGIGSSRVSVPSVAVDLAQDVLGGLADRRVMLLGAGETSELTAQALAAQGVGTIFVANRHADRALSLARRFGGSVVGLDKLPEQLADADIVVSSTSSPHPILGAEELALVMAERRGRPLLLIDIAVPRDIDSRCADLEGVTLYDIDDLQAVVRRNLGAREEIVPQAEEIVEEEIKRFARWLGQAEALPTVAALRQRGDEIVERVLSENQGRWEAATERDLMRVEAVARAVLNRFLHEPTIRLRSFSAERGHASLQLVRELFALDTPQGGTGEDAPHEGVLAGETPAEDPDATLAEVRSIKSARKGQ
ncbi:MAG: glutamyl-tRNA reductase [Solirubrobacteraceae bacterium]